MKAGRELDNLITEKLFKVKACSHKLYEDDEGSWCSESCDNEIPPQYSMDLNEAILLLEFVSLEGVPVNLSYSAENEEWICKVGTKEESSESPAHAICLAILYLISLH